MATREIVTLQFGHYPNFVGTHWWNIQESSFVYDPQVLTKFPKEVNHDVLYREGKTVSGHTTFTPRLVLVDLRGSLGSLKKEGDLYGNVNEENIQWLGDVTLHKTDAAKKNRFLQDLEEEEVDVSENIHNDKTEESELIDETDVAGKEISDDANSPSKTESDTNLPKYQLDSEVTVWSDCLRTSLHPRSVHILNEYQHNDSNNAFNIFGQGQQIAKSCNEWDMLEDKVRYFTEECDHLQGFHVMFDNNTGFGGLTSAMLSYLCDEYPSKARFTLPMTPACPSDQTAKDRASRILNTALSLHHCSEMSSLYVPLCLAQSLWKAVGPPLHFDHLNYKAELSYHTSAILATALDTASLPYRKEHSPACISDITGSFSTLGRKMSALNLSLPFPMRLGSSVADSLMALGQCDPWTSLTPGVTCTSSPVFQSCVLRGVPDFGAKLPQNAKHNSHNSPLLSCNSVADVLKLYLCETYPASYNSGCHMRDGVVTSTPFPHIFSPHVNWHGFAADTQRPQHLGVEQVPTMTSLQTSPDVEAHITSLTDCVSKFNISKHQHFIEAGLEEDDFIETIDQLRQLASCYEND